MARRRYVFLLGRPGSGKSDFYRRLGARLSVRATLPKRLDDFPKLEELAQFDNDEEASGHARRFTRSLGTSWVATQMAYDEVLQRIDHELRAERVEPAEIVFVEFARSDMVRAIEENFSTLVRDQAFLIYVYCPFDVCVERNRRRRGAGERGQDDHEVPERQMRRRYGDDDHDRLHELGIPYAVVDNHLEGIDYLDLEVEKVVRMLAHEAGSIPR